MEVLPKFLSNKAGLERLFQQYSKGISYEKE
jgi:hypothetical protein